MKFSLFLIILFISLQTKLWVGKDGIINLYALQKAIALQHQKNIKLIAHNQKLECEIQSLKLVNHLEAMNLHSSSLIEDYARRKLGMIKKGEVFFAW